MYGPTETTIWSTARSASSGPTDAHSIGRPIANTRVYVLDASGAAGPDRRAGELCIGGAGVARGYREPARADRRAVRHPGPAGPTRRSACTAPATSRASAADGRIEYLGRRDHQVKLRGFRIELGEIEAVLGGTPGVAEGVVAVRERRRRANRGWWPTWCRKPDKPSRRCSVRDALCGRLPEYMVRPTSCCSTRCR